MPGQTMFFYWFGVGRVQDPALPKDWPAVEGLVFTMEDTKYWVPPRAGRNGTI